jgi:hypothetical protein
VCCGLVHRTVQCTRTVQGPTSHSRENSGALRYNSPDCPVCHQTIRCVSGQWLSSAQRSTLTALQCRGRSQRGTGLSSAPPDCPVPQEDKGANGQLLQNPNGWVTWGHTRQPTVHVRWSDAPIASSLPNGYFSG